MRIALEYMMQDPNFFSVLSKSLYESSPAVGDMELRRPPMKKNSELLNSLLGLPKNILKSG